MYLNISNIFSEIGSYLEDIIAGGSSAVVALGGLAYYLILVIADWKIFKKAGKPGWLSLIPIVNIWVAFSIATGYGAKMFFLLIPVFGQIYGAFVFPWKLIKSFDRSGWFYVGMLLFTPIFTIILGFDSSTYIGPRK